MYLYNNFQVFFKCKCLQRLLHLIIVKIVRTIEEMNENYSFNVLENFGRTYREYYLPPYFFPKDLEYLYEVQCKRREQSSNNFDENLKGFTLI